MHSTLWVATSCAIITSVTCIVFAVARRRGRGWALALVAASGIAAILAVGALWVWADGKSAEIWVNRLPANHDTLRFVAPRASGAAEGSDFVFNSTAGADAVFDAFLKEFPDAVRTGTEASFTLDGYRYVLAYDPGADDFAYIFYNEENTPQGKSAIAPDGEGHA